MNEQEAERACIQEKLDELAHLSKQLDTIHVTDFKSWKQKEEVSEAYMEVSDWLWSHGILPQ